MKRIVLFTDEKNATELRAFVAKYNDFVITEDNPSVVLVYGGDGTFLRAQYRWPEVPALILRKSSICKLCSSFSNEEAIEKYLRGEFRIVQLPLLEARAHGKNMYGVNDIIVHNADPRHAIRYTIDIDTVSVGEKEIIGDGIVVATPLGSTGYYRSITDSSFLVGVGLAFNNSTEQSDHMVADSRAVIRMCITRGPAMVYADNQRESIEVCDGDEVIIRQSEKTSSLIRF